MMEEITKASFNIKKYLVAHAHTHTLTFFLCHTHTHTHTHTNWLVCACVCVCVYLVVHAQTHHTYNTHTLISVCVCVLLSNKMRKDALVISFIIVLIINFFSNNTVSLFETFMTISTMNTKSGTNGILPHRTKRGITWFTEASDMI